MTIILKSLDANVIIDTTANSNTLSVTGIELIAITLSTAAACGLSIGNELKYEIVLRKF